MALPTWNLQDILKHDDIPQIIAEMRERIAKLESEKEGFTPDMSVAAFKNVMDQLEQLSRAMGKLGCYAYNWTSEDTNNQEAQALYNKIAALGVEENTRLLFINQEWKRFDETNAKRLMDACPEYKYHLKTVYDGKQHMLSDAEEQLATIKDLNGTNALEKIYDLITSNFEYEFQGKKLNQQELVEFVRSPNRATRKEAYETLFKPYKKNKDVLGAIYTHIIDDWRREAELRKYSDSISVRNHSNDIPNAAIKTLLAVCKKNAPIFQEFFKKKAKILCIKDFARYDLYAPLDDTKETLSFDEAVEKILAVFSSFNTEFSAAAKKIVDAQHIHAEIKKGKRGGAYCYGPSPEDIPYVLLSYTGTPESASTLAHELGHGVHGILANKHNSFNHHAQLPICEIASIFSELLLAEKLKEEKPNLARSMTMSQIDGFYASIMRQAWFVMFEEKAHSMVADSPTIDQMADEYMSELKQQFGDIEIPEQFKYEWIYIPHIFHSPFYCYAYSFGNLLSLALYAQYKKDPSFAENIMTLLATGGSTSPAEMVKIAGFDITDATFWQGGFDVIEEMISQL